eukprot:3390218-Lingulodinium_polyedra.AAC.1
MVPATRPGPLLGPPLRPLRPGPVGGHRRAACCRWACWPGPPLRGTAQWRPAPGGPGMARPTRAGPLCCVL